jgi:hypothetical protein
VDLVGTPGVSAGAARGTRVVSLRGVAGTAGPLGARGGGPLTCGGLSKGSDLSHSIGQGGGLGCDHGRVWRG